MRRYKEVLEKVLNRKKYRTKAEVKKVRDEEDVVNSPFSAWAP